MSDPATYAAIPIATSAGVGLIAIVLGVPPTTVFMAFFGAIVGVAVSDKVSYGVGAGMIFVGTVAGATLTPIVIEFTGKNYTQQGIAMGIGFAIVFFRRRILDSIGRKIDGAAPSAPSMPPSASPSSTIEHPGDAGGAP